MELELLKLERVQNDPVDREEWQFKKRRVNDSEDDVEHDRQEDEDGGD